jgi:tripartite-type tricarboxylate transporter receptor subunit TctC
MKPSRRRFLKLIGATAGAPAFAPFAHALDYPTRPVHVIVGYAAGGGTDIFVRLATQALTERFGGNFVVENRAGASSNIATDAVVRAAPDGYTVLGTDAAAAINATLYSNLTFNFVRDITTVGMTIGPLLIILHPTVPVRTVPEFIAYTKANHVSMASAGTGNATHMAGELFKVMAHVDMTHVPYRGAGPAIVDLLGGQVQVYFGSAPAAIDHIRSGRLRAIAVTSKSRFDALPDLPTVNEFLPGFEASQWFAMGVRRGTAPAIAETLNKNIVTVLSDAKMKARLADLGSEIVPGSAADLDKFVAEETEKWAKVVKAAGIKPE